MEGSSMMKLIQLIVLCGVVLGVTYVAARLTRYEITIGGGTRYYSVIKLDRWTGETWKLDNNGIDWNKTEPTTSP